MTIREVQDGDFPSLTELFRSFFPTHNRFSQDAEDVMFYLREQAQKDMLIVYDEGGSLRGALFLVNTGQNADSSHKLWKFRHLAFVTEEVGAALLHDAEQRVKSASLTSKIEQTIAENESGIDLYKDNGYKLEGALKHHYRPKETCFVLSKSFV